MTINQFENLKQDTFYKFMSLEKLDRFLEYISKGKLYASKYDQLNDPFEGRFNRGKLGKDTISSIEETLKKTRICAFFKKKDDQDCPDDFLMWSHYANSHHGCCFEFQLTKQYNTGNWSVIPIEYKNDLPAPNGNDDNSILNIVSVKTQDWEYENEVRAVKILEKEDKKTKTYYYIKLKAVYFGLSVPSEKIELYAKIVYALKPNVSVYRMKKKIEDPSQYPLIRPELIQNKNLNKNKK